VKVISERLETILSGDGIHEAQPTPMMVITICRSHNSVRLFIWLNIFLPNFALKATLAWFNYFEK
jgi:hypothetical protein